MYKLFWDRSNKFYYFAAGEIDVSFLKELVVLIVGLASSIIIEHHFHQPTLTS